MRSTFPFQKRSSRLFEKWLLFCCSSYPFMMLPPWTRHYFKVDNLLAYQKGKEMRLPCFFNQSPVFDTVFRQWTALDIALFFSLSLRHQSVPTMILLCLLPPSEAASALGVSDRHLFWWPTLALLKGLKTIWWFVLIRDAGAKVEPRLPYFKDCRRPDDWCQYVTRKQSFTPDGLAERHNVMSSMLDTV